MASLPGEKANTLIQDLATDPYRFNFFTAVRLLENTLRSQPRVGYSQRIEEDAVRFGQNASLIFAPSTLDKVEPATDARPPRVFVNFLGLLGPNGPMPGHLTEFIYDRQLNSRDATLARFFDVFNHRILSLFYRAWSCAQKSVDFDRPSESRFAAYIGSLFGMGMQSLLHRDSVPDCAKLYFSGRLSCQTKHPEGLEAILSDFFGVRTQVQELVGFWMLIPEANQCRLGESPETGSIGRNAIAGSRKFEAQLKFRIRMGPMDLASFRRLLPGGLSFRRIRDWVLNYVGSEFFWDIQCVLLAKEVPATSLGKSGQLGWTTWLQSKPFAQDAEDAIFDPERCG